MVDEDVIAGMEQAGFPEERIAATRAAAKAAHAAANEFEVWPDNWRTVRVFSGLSTQWRLAPMGGFSGLDYAAVEAALRIWRAPRRRWRALFADIQIMEAAVVDYFNEKREAD